MANTIYANEYLSPQSYIRIYKMGKLVIISGSITFATENVVNVTIISNIPIKCMDTCFTMGSSWGSDDGGVMGTLHSNAITIAGTPTINKEYRFQVVSFEVQ